MLISVVIATYNSQKYIIPQLDSIRKQTVKPHEVIIVDDFSEDQTIKMLHTYIESNHLENWSIHKHKKNRGYIQTFSDAFSYASGDIVLLCDHDDIWLPNKVEIIEREFKNNKDILSLVTKFEQIDANGNSVPIQQKKKHANNNLIRRKIYPDSLNKMDLQDVAIYNISPGCTYAVKKDLIDIYLKEDHQLPHDWKLNILAACLEGLYYLDIATTRYRVYSHNTIGLGHQNDFQKRAKNVAKNYEEKKESTKIVSCLMGEKSEEYKYYKAIERIFRQRKEFMKNGNFFLGMKTFLTSLKYGKLYESVAMDFISRIKS